MRALRAIGLVLLTCGGCASEPYSVAPVAGKVLLDGKPLADAHLTFQPVGSASLEPGPGSYGKTNEHGEFTLELVGKNRPGAVVGQHRVNITAPSGPAFDPADDRPRQVKDRVPEPYRKGVDFEVPKGGTADAVFDLKTK